MSDGAGKMPAGADDSERALLEEVARIHEEYMARFNALRERQKRLLTSVLERIDREKTQQILSSIKGGTNDKSPASTYGKS